MKIFTISENVLKGEKMMGKTISREMKWFMALLLILAFSLVLSIKGEAASYTLTLDNNWTNGIISTIGDADSYYFSINEAGFVKIVYQGLSIGDSNIQILDGNEIRVFEKGNVYTSSVSNPVMREYNLALEAGKYCIKVWGYGKCVGDYRLKGDFLPANSTEIEPNNSFDDAMELPNGESGSVCGFISRTDKVDFYKIQLPYDQKIKITYSSKIGDSYCEIWNADKVRLKRQIVSKASEESEQTFIYEKALKAGTYYIKIIPYTGSEGRYTLSWETEQLMVCISDITIKGNRTMNVGEYQYLSASVIPTNATDQSVRWASSNIAVATVDDNGRVCARKSGRTIITALAQDGSNERGICAITVGETDVPENFTTVKWVTKIAVSGNKKVAAGQKFTLKAKVSPANAANKAVTWVSSDQKVATVSAKGVVTAKMPGKTTIMVKAKDRNIISSKLTVIVLPKKMATPKVSSSSRKLKVTYTKQSGVSGYQVAYGLKKNFKRCKIVLAEKNKQSVLIKNLSKRKTYYTRVRSYIKVGSKTYYGKWSNVKKVKIK